MKKKSRASQTKPHRSFAQEMHLAFTEWVNRLPIIKKDAPKVPEGKDQKKISPPLD